MVKLTLSDFVRNTTLMKIIAVAAKANDVLQQTVM